MAKHLMVDLETIAVTPRATILTLGAVHFNPYGMGYSDKLYMRFDLDAQDALGREVDPNTLEWWSKQDPKIMEEAFSPENRVPLAEAVDKFHKFAWGCDAFWAHGSLFDIAILEDLYRQMEKPVPWQYWQIRDTRTIFDLGWDPDMPKAGLHDALQDAIRQAAGVQNIYSKLKVKPR
jgi:hypothetical protein